LDAPLVDDAPLGDALTAFLARLPFGRLTRPRAIVALAPAFAQTKRLGGLPPLGDERVLAQTVREHVERFFLRDGIPLVTTSVRLDAEGRPWAAALQKTVVDTIVAACRTSRVRLSGVVTVADVSRPALDALMSLGTEAPLFSAAYGAAITPGALTWRSEAHEEGHVPRWRLLSAASAATLALVMAVLAPGLAARVAEHRTIIHAARIAGATHAAQRVAGDLAHVTSALGEVAAFERGGRPVTFLAVALARALPDGAALLALHVDSSGGSVVALAPRAAALLTRLEQVPHLAALEIVGPVTLETGSGHAVERVTIRFRWMREP
jgi:hypothetical protein